MFKENQINQSKNNEHYDVVLLQLPLWGAYHPPLSHGLLKSYLGHHGITCKTIDLNAEIYSTRGKKYFDFWHVKHSQSDKLFVRKTMMEMYKDFRPIMLYYMNEIRKASPLVVGCSIFDSSRIISEIFFEDLRKNVPGCKHIMGGPGVAHFMKNTEELLSHDHIDAVCQDEGENALLDYYNAVKNNTGEPVAGVVYKHNGKVLQGPPSQYKGKLDTLPYPNFDDVNIKHYIDRTLPLYSSRGCVNKCNYCSAIGFMTNKRYPFRFRSGQRMFDEVVYLTNKYPEIEEIRFANNIDNGKVRALEEFCDLMIESGLNKKVTWCMESSVIRKEMRKPFYEKLAEAGCTFINYGVETPAKHLLEKVGKTLAINKDVDLPAILKEGSQAGIDININIMFGLPGETEDDFKFLKQFLSDYKDTLTMVSPALQFCEYYPGSPGNSNPDSIGVDFSKGTLMWESKDGTNTYLTRMDRFEKLTAHLRKLKIHNFFQVDEIVDKWARLFEYYYVSKDPENAKINYHKIPKEQLTEQITAKYIHITTGDTSALKKYDEKRKKKQIAKIEDYLAYRGTLEKNFIHESLDSFIQDYVNVKPYDREYPIATWKHNVRKFALAATGYNKIETLISKVLIALGKIDKTLISASELQLSSNDKFTLIEKSFDNLDLLINNTDKSMNSLISKSIKKINKTSYYHEKICEMLHLFVNAFRIINDDKFDVKNNDLNSITDKLFKLLNSTDENENRIFSKLQIETRIMGMYNRIIGYRNTERGIAMLHSTMSIIIRKLVEVKCHESSVKISTPERQVHNLNGATSNPAHVSK